MSDTLVREPVLDAPSDQTETLTVEAVEVPDTIPDGMGESATEEHMTPAVMGEAVVQLAEKVERQQQVAPTVGRKALFGYLEKPGMRRRNGVPQFGQTYIIHR